MDTAIGRMAPGLKVLPRTEEMTEALDWVGEVLGRADLVQTLAVEAPPITFDDGRFKPFVGFGEQAAVASAREVSCMAPQAYLRLLKPMHEWVDILRERLGDAILTSHQVTRIELDESGRATSVVVNDTKTLRAPLILACFSPRHLQRLLPEQATPARLKQRILKGEIWTAVNLDLSFSPPVSDSLAVHVFKGANEEPCVGLFDPAITPEGPQLSRWVTYVSREHSDEAELMASALKQISRQIKRAYPQALEQKRWERITVEMASVGDLSETLDPDGNWAKVSGLRLISPLARAKTPVLAGLQQTRAVMTQVLSELSARPVVNPVPAGEPISSP
jgi:hypothetical protein